MSMKQKLLLLMGGMMLTAFSLPLAAQSISWTDDSQKPDTLWYTEHKEGTEYTLTKCFVNFLLIFKIKVVNEPFSMPTK